MKLGNNVIIIGGGLSGLSLGYFLKKKGIEATILEASERLGGRIQTVVGTLGTPLELGATWFSDLHIQLLELMEELGLAKYPQYSEGISLFQTKSFEPPQKFYVPGAESPSYRLVGGTQKLTDTLAAQLGNSLLHINKKVVAVRQAEDHLVVETADGSTLTTNKVILCIPPQLAGATIQFSPGLPESITSVLPNVQTWMAGSLKFTLEYDEPFWIRENYSGMLYSHAGIVTEMYDHTNFEGDKYGFTGFLNSGAAVYSQEVRKDLVLRQLTDLFGPKAGDPTLYLDKVWNDELLTGGSSIILRPHQNNGHPCFFAPYMDGRLHFCGTETASTFSGYMEGAIRAARYIADKF